MNTQSNMKAYLEQAFDIGKLDKELSNRDSFFMGEEEQNDFIRGIISSTFGDKITKEGEYNAI
ncbi:hypothetical protein [Clostridium peptidivorans]|uniref:hypothetical protein n=1 Tax=Clostridium peptidivorans TaxID=100174 RepID=UPI000BE24A42|nr:hypothetical protein [Clostridium peptidivorans]